MTIHLNSTGGLGNQLFQIAALIETADRLKTDKHIRFKSSGNTNREFESKVLLNALEIELCSFRCRFNYRGKSYTQQESDLEIYRALPDSSRLHGYFQDQEYSVHARQKIIDAIGFYAQNCCSSKLSPGENDVAIHVRLGDYLLNPTNFSIHGVLSSDYFERAIESIQSSLKIENIYVFSDNPDIALEKISRITSKIDSGIRVKTGSCNIQNLLCELYMIGEFDNLVLSNSSFSWWSAIMRNRKNSIGPSRWYRDESKQNMNPMLSNWLKILNEFEGEGTVNA